MIKAKSGNYKNVIEEPEQRLMNVTNVIRAIRDVNQLITREKDVNSLIKKSCRILTETRGYTTAWIIILDEKGILKLSCQS